MGEKRFERWNDYSCKVKDNHEDIFLNWKDVVNKLNALAEENERLHHLKVLAHAFIVEKGLEGEFIRWSNEIGFLKNMVIDDE